MKHILLATVFTLVFGLAALSQTTPGTQAPADTNPSTQPQTSPSQSSDMSKMGDEKGEKKLKGCIQGSGGSFTLEEKGGKTVALSGSDLSAHVGHMVTVHGSYASGGSSGSSAASGGGMSAGGGQTFNVTKVDMVSESCSLDKGKKEGSSDNSKPNPGHK